MLVALARPAAADIDAERVSPFWGALAPGAFEAGFRVLREHDLARQWAIEATASSSGRPLRVSVWYPARTGGSPLTYEAYVRPPGESPYRGLEEQLASAHLQALGNVLLLPGDVERLLATSIGARDAPPPAPGEHPVVLYSSGLNESWQHAGFLLAEYLASHGYVVVTVPQLPTSDEEELLGLDPRDLETQMRDLEEALVAVWAAFPYASRQRRALVGHSMGGVAALLLGMRHPAADAVIGLDASYGTKGLARTARESTWFAPRRYRQPLLDLRRANPDGDRQVLGELHFAPRYQAVFPRAQHADFTTFPMVAALFPTRIEGRTVEDALAAQREVVQLSLAFLDSFVRQDPVARATLDRRAPGPTHSWERLAGLPSLPSEREFGLLIERRGYEVARELLRSLAGSLPRELPVVQEGTMLQVGYGYLARGRTDLALQTFRLAAEAHPTSANVWDSVAEAYLAAGDEEGARQACAEVLRLLPRDERLSPQERETLRKTAEERLARLR